MTLNALALDRFSLCAMLAGVALVLEPWWSGGFPAGFAVTGIGVVLQIVAAHLPRKAKP